MVDKINRPKAFTPASARRIARAVKKVEAGEALDVSRGPADRTSRDPEIWVKITGKLAFEDDARKFKYAWTQQRQTADGLEDMTGGLSGTTSSRYALNALEPNQTSVPSGTKVRLHIEKFWDSSAGKWVQAFRFSWTPGAMGLIPVSLTFDTGDNGTKTTEPTYKYKNPINLLTGDEIKMADGSAATALEPEVGREVGMFDQATKGEVYIDGDGNTVLWRAYEKEQVC